MSDVNVLMNQILLVDSTTFGIVVVLAVLTAFVVREAMGGATLTSLAFFPCFVAAGLISVFVSNQSQLFTAGDNAANTVIATTIGIAVMLLVLLVFIRLLTALGDRMHKLW